jgi:sec-independent protein translocase protein TatA
MEAIILFVGGIGFQEILLIGAVVLILFGAKRVPEFMKGLGKGVKEFKQGIKDVQDDIERSPSDKDVKE